MYFFPALCVTMSSRSYPSGRAKRKIAKRIENLVQAQKGDIHKLFKRNTGVSINPNDELAIIAVEEEQLTNENSESNKHEENIDSNIGDSNVSGSSVHNSS